MGAPFEIGQWVHWPTRDGRVIRGRVVTCVGPDDEGIYAIAAKRCFPPVLYRVLSGGRGIHARRNLEVERYETRFHTIRHRLGQSPVPARAAPQTPVASFPFHQPPVSGAFSLRGNHG